MSKQEVVDKVEDVVFSNKKIDRKLLMELFRTEATSRQTKKMENYIKDFLDSYKIFYEQDELGNIFNLNNIGAPLLSAHMDTVQREDDLKLTNSINFFRTEDLSDVIIKGKGIIGADDKYGIYLILSLLRHFKNKQHLNFVFAVDEEIGLVGAKYLSDKKGDLIKENCLYCLVFDRWGKTDIICNSNDYGSVQFEKALEGISDKYNLGMKATRGVLCDADSYRDYISCANICVGYYKHHTKDEYGSLNDLSKSFEFTVKVIEEVSNKFEATEKQSYKKYYYKGNSNYFNSKYKKSSYKNSHYGHSSYSDYSDVEYDSEKGGYVHTGSQSSYYEDLVTCSITGESFDGFSDDEVYLTETFGYIGGETLKKILKDLSTCLVEGPIDLLELYEEYYSYPDYNTSVGKSFNKKKDDADEVSVLTQEDIDFFKEFEEDVMVEKFALDEREAIEKILEEEFKKEV